MGFWKSKNIVNFNVFFGGSKIFEFNCETLVIYRWKITVSVELLFWFKMRNFESLDKQNLFFDKCEKLRVIRGLKFKNWRGWKETHDVLGWHFVVVCDVKSPPIIEGKKNKSIKVQKIDLKNRIKSQFYLILSTWYYHYFVIIRYFYSDTVSKYTSDFSIFTFIYRKRKIKICCICNTFNCKLPQKSCIFCPKISKMGLIFA